MTTWDQISSAIQAAIANASGVTTIWKAQNADAPALPYIAITLGVVTTVGFDYVQASTDLHRPAGQEIALTIGGLREVPMQLEAFTAPISAGAVTPAAITLLDLVRSKLRLPTMRQALRAVGVTPFDPGPVQYIPEVVAVGFRGRASLDVRCMMPAQAVAEYTGYIASLKGSVVATDGGAGAPLVLPLDAP